MECEQKNIYQRIIAIMSDINYIQKGPKKAAGMYTYVSHDAVSEAIHPLLVKHGVAAIPTVKSLAQEGNRTIACVSMNFINIDNPKDLFTVEGWGYGIDTGDKGPGKCVSYAVKYIILKTFCLETGDDPDNDQNATFEPFKEENKVNQMSIEEYKELTYYLDKLPEYKSEILKFLDKVSIKNLWEMSPEMRNKVVINCKKKLGIEEISHAAE